MKKRGEKLLCGGSLMLALFVVWTWLVQSVDVRPAGQFMESDIYLRKTYVSSIKSEGLHIYFLNQYCPNQKCCNKNKSYTQ